MKETQSHAELVARRAELLAELFLQEMDPTFVARPTRDLTFDFFVGFQNPHDGINLTAVEVKSTERPVNGRFPISKRLYDRCANSNIPVLILVVDVKQNRLFYAWPSAENSDANSADTVTIRLEEIDEKTKKLLRKQLMA